MLPWGTDAARPTRAGPVRRRQPARVMTHHGQLYLRDHVPPRSAYYDRGRYGRLFPSLPPFSSDTPSSSSIP